MIWYCGCEFVELIELWLNCELLMVEVSEKKCVVC